MPFSEPRAGGFDVRDSHVEERRHRSIGARHVERDVGLVGGARPAWVHDDPRITGFEDHRILLDDHLGFEQVCVELPRPGNVRDDDEMGEEHPLLGRGKVVSIHDVLPDVALSARKNLALPATGATLTSGRMAILLGP